MYEHKMTLTGSLLCGKTGEYELIGVEHGDPYWTGKNYCKQCGKDVAA